MGDQFLPARWGDYLGSAPDEPDEGNVWVIGQYGKSISSGYPNTLWGTWVNLVSYQANFTVTASPWQVIVPPGGTGPSTITVTSLNGFSSSVLLSCVNPPSGITCSFAANPVLPPANGSVTSGLTVAVGSLVNPGTYSFLVQGTSTSTTSTAMVQVVVQAPDFQLLTTPPQITIGQGNSAQATVVVAGLQGYASPVTLTTSTLPSGISVGFSANPVTPAPWPGGTSTMTLTATGSATLGTYTFQVIGTAGALTHQFTETLYVQPCPPQPTVQVTDGTNPSCAGFPVTLDAGPGYSSYSWSTGDTTEAITVAPVTSSVYTVTVTNACGTSAPTNFSQTVNAVPATPVVTAPSSAQDGAAGLTASVPVVAGVSYAWSITNGTITAGQSTNAITFSVGAPGSTVVTATETNGVGCPSTGSAVVAVAPGSGLRFYTVAPCRLIDTRRPTGTWGGPALQGGGATRSFPVDAQCGVPNGAIAIAGNVTVVGPTGRGDLRIFPMGIPAPTISSINFNSGRTRANNVIVAMNGNPIGSITVQCDMTGTTNMLFDINGYFQ